MKKPLGIIPARAGSKGIPRKNTYLIRGVPLVEYTMQAARSSGIFERIVLTTDCPEIAGIARHYEIEVIKRPNKLATDTARMEDVVLDVLSFFPDESVFVLLQPTSPLRRKEHIADAWRIFSEQGEGSVVSVCELSHHPFKSLTLDGDLLSPAFGTEFLSMPRQALPSCVRQNGAVYICDVVAFKRQKSFIVSPSRAYVMTERDSCDVDVISDVQNVEAILAAS